VWAGPGPLGGRPSRFRLSLVGMEALGYYVSRRAAAKTEGKAASRGCVGYREAVFEKERRRSGGRPCLGKGRLHELL
jgi:hypothetical protein